MVYALQKFHHYLLGTPFKLFTNHSTLKYLVNKPVLGGRIYHWLFLFQEFEFEVVVKLGKYNVGLDHLSRLSLVKLVKVSMMNSLMHNSLSKVVPDQLLKSNSHIRTGPT
jgi:hypothetical protein